MLTVRDVSTGSPRASGERRRSVRRCLHRPAAARLYRFHDRGEPTWGTLLNAGVHGVACGVVESDPDGFAVGERVRLVFALPEDPGAFEVAGRVASRTQAGTPGRWVLGLELDWNHSGDGEHERFRAALAAAAGRGVVANGREETSL